MKKGLGQECHSESNKCSWEHYLARGLCSWIKCVINFLLVICFYAIINYLYSVVIWLWFNVKNFYFKWLMSHLSGLFHSNAYIREGI